METKTYLFPDVNCDLAYILAENERFKSRIAALSAPPTKAEIESVAIVLAGMYGTFHTPLDYSDDKNAAKAAIETLLNGRGV